MMAEDDVTTRVLTSMARMEVKMEQVLESNEKLTDRVTELEKTVQGLQDIKV